MRGLAGAVLLGGAAAKSSVTPIQKVIELLTGLHEKGQAELTAESVQFARYKQWCGDTMDEKERAIAEAGDQMQMLQAGSQKASEDAAELNAQIAEDQAMIATQEQDVAADRKVRKMEREDYVAMHRDYSESIDALTKAIQTLKQQAFNRAQDSTKKGLFDDDEAALDNAFLQKLNEMPLMPARERATLTAFIASEESDEMLQPGQAHAYEFQSGRIVDMLEKLKVKFQDERTAIEREEANKKHSSELAIQDANAFIQAKKDDVQQNKVLAAKRAEASATMAQELTETTNVQRGDQEFLQTITNNCHLKEEDFGTRQELRRNEIAAIAEAISILKGDTVQAGERQKYGGLFAQFASEKKDTQLIQRVASMFHETGLRLHSDMMLSLAEKVAQDPFAKVRELITQLITRLEEEAAEEAEHKGWCDTELSHNEQTRQNKETEVEGLRASIDQASADIEKLTTEIGELQTQKADATKMVAEATEQRNEEKAANTKTIEEAKAAQTAVANVIVILRQSQVGMGSALLQAETQQPAAPEIFDAPYQGMVAEGGGILGLLDVIVSDFAKLETDTTAEEAQAQRAFDEMMTENSTNQATRDAEITGKTNLRTQITQTLSSKNGDLETTQQELDAANQYYEKLKPSCINTGMSHEERQARRADEIASLKEALAILEGETP